ncbi:Signal peptidase complex subunit [Vermiconidia calcicola]|uniref:Signal peptidase complex subunit n=1 Tax=Vermiconidia calcicola TaxID=1690605 RepID=A0ACC3NJK2_9PEZI|nr:Signal peptidase complex subunit [Vermiconidia calcicola]
MHSSLVRIQNVFGYFTSVAFAVAAAVAVSVLLSSQTPSASLELKNVQVVKGRPHYYSTKREEYAHVKFDLDAGMRLAFPQPPPSKLTHPDLTSLFNWNTKQIFMYITASYPSTSPSIPPSEAVIWDAIIPSDHAPFHPNTYIHPTSKTPPKSKSKSKSKGKPYPEGASAGIVKLSNQKPKYQITDVSGKIAERENATLSLHWNVQPWVGALVWTNTKSYGRWSGLKGGADKFDFPSLKGSETIKKEDLKTETGAEKNRGSPA